MDAIEDFVLNEYYTPISDLGLLSSSVYMFYKGRPYRCSRAGSTSIQLHNPTIPTTDNTYPLFDDTRASGGWVKMFTQWHGVTVVVAPLPRDIEAELYDAFKAGAVTPGLLVAYKVKTGRDRPGYML